MRPHNPNLTALWQTDPKEAAAKVRGVVESASTMDEAARTLGVGRATLFRWLKRPELKEAGA